MKLKVHKHTKNDFYEIFCNWLNTHSFPLINKEVLPENVFVLYVDDIPCYCVWVYYTDSKLAWVAFPASNKNVNYNKKQGGLTFLMNYVCDYLKKKKILLVFTTSATESVKESLKESGFEIGDSGVEHYLKKLKN